MDQRAACHGSRDGFPEVPIWRMGMASRVLGTATGGLSAYLGFTFFAHDVSGTVLYPWDATFKFGPTGVNALFGMALTFAGIVILIAAWRASLRLTDCSLVVTNVFRGRSIAHVDVRSLDLDYWGLRIGYDREASQGSVVAFAGMSLLNTRFFPGQSRTWKIADQVRDVYAARGVFVDPKYRGRHSA